MAAAWSREKEAYYGQCLGSLEGTIQALSDNSAHMRQVSFTFPHLVAVMVCHRRWREGPGQETFPEDRPDEGIV